MTQPLATSLTHRVHVRTLLGLLVAITIIAIPGAARAGDAEREKARSLVQPEIAAQRFEEKDEDGELAWESWRYDVQSGPAEGLTFISRHILDSDTHVISVRYDDAGLYQRVITPKFDELIAWPHESLFVIQLVLQPRDDGEAVELLAVCVRKTHELAVLIRVEDERLRPADETELQMFRGRVDGLWGDPE